MRGDLRWTLTALVLFGVSFGYVEAAVVVYLRALYEPIHERAFPGRKPGDLFPVLRPDQLEELEPQALRWAVTELVREAATLLMLASAGLAVGRNFRQAFAGFLIAFGIWDVIYYVSLRLLIGWPSSLGDWDLLFLLPVPWTGPVLAPVLVALSMVGAGVLLLRREFSGRPVRIAPLDWAGAVVGGFIIVLAFCWEAQTVSAGGRPESFPWPLFALGGGLAQASFLHSIRARAPSP
jgi:hypothetical protein